MSKLVQLKRVQIKKSKINFFFLKIHQQLIDGLCGLLWIVCIRRDPRLDLPPEFVDQVQLPVKGASAEGECEDSGPGAAGVDDHGVLVHSDSQISEDGVET